MRLMFYRCFPLILSLDPNSLSLESEVLDSISNLEYPYLIVWLNLGTTLHLSLLLSQNSENPWFMVSSSSSLVIPGMRERKYIIEVCICFELWVECSEIVQFKFLQGDKKKFVHITHMANSLNNCLWGSCHGEGVVVKALYVWTHWILIMTIEVDSIIFIILSSIQVNKLEPGKWKNMPKLPWPAMVKPGEISGSKIVCSHFVIEAVDSNP